MTAFSCPNCAGTLQREELDHGIMWRCPSCGGRATGIGVLRRVLDRSFSNAVWLAATEEGSIGELRCPVCRNPMYRTATEPVALDVCRPCRFIWFDPGEFDLPPRSGAETPDGPDLSQDQIESIARISAEEIARKWRNKPDAEIGDQLALVPGVLGLPVEEIAPEISRNPWVTYGLAFLLTLVSGWVVLGGEVVIRDYGLLPSDAFRLGGLTFVTSFFLHAGLYHLLTNVYFLFVFGDNVEDFLGRGNYVLLLIVSALAGAAVHALLAPERSVPLVGASAGISGVIVFYGLRFPQARLRYFRLLRWLSMPAAAATGFWLVTQLVGARDQLSGNEDVSFLAHLGGALVGLWFWFLWRND